MPAASRSLAAPMAMSVYPSEREALKRIMAEKQLKTPFDVVRLMAMKSEHVKSEEFKFPKYID